ncbi:hypothetical protein BDY21DRAFT_374503 [Lineolata rhizophorae]|uniref:Uncharacterized protein n=1 Tax=Lineolata rhizophorae TaxID=578093 RepID=A0A6A6NQB8_9PEZI|nr:hypothetical protein BDY21DRAFT_374503 [Lineolata rhizophorae]
MATITVGGDDIDFVGLVRNCVYEIYASRTCEEQLAHSWNLLNSDDLIDNIDRVIKGAVEKGRDGSIGDDFKLYVTGYPDFFNIDTDQCSTVTWSWNRNKPGEHQRMTKELRTTFSDMSNQLNLAVIKAVDRNYEKNVYWVDWQASGALDTHRYCEEGIEEPDLQRVVDGKTWFFHYPYNDAGETWLRNLVANLIDPEVETESELEAKYHGNLPAIPTSLINGRPFFDALFEQAANRNGSYPKTKLLDPDRAEVEFSFFRGRGRGCHYKQ